MPSIKNLISGMAVYTVMLLGACSDSTAPRQNAPPAVPVLKGDLYANGRYSSGLITDSTGQMYQDGEYVVSLADNIDPSAFAAARGLTIYQAVEGVGAAFGALLTDSAVDALKMEGEVLSVKRDYLLGEPGETNAGFTLDPAPWDISRISRRSGRSGIQSKASFTQSGQGVMVYIMDSGVLSSHPEFQNADGTSKITRSLNATNDGTPTGDGEPCPNTVQGFSHGTTVASLVAGNKSGAAPNASIGSVRIQWCTGGPPTSHLVYARGLGLIQADMKLSGISHAIVNLSYFGRDPAAIADTTFGPTRKFIDVLRSKNILFITIAGNASDDACSYYPAALIRQYNGGLTVGATDNNDAIVAGTNFGQCVSIMAPGANATAADIHVLAGASVNVVTGGHTGTSISAPLVAAIAAQVWGRIRH